MDQLLLHHLTPHQLHRHTQHQLLQAIHLDRRLRQFKWDQHKATHIQAHRHPSPARPTCCSAVHHKWHQFRVSQFPMHQLQLPLHTGKQQSLLTFSFLTICFFSAPAAPSYAPAPPKPSYSPAPAPSYSPAPAPSYSPAPAPPSYRQNESEGELTSTNNNASALPTQPENTIDDQEAADQVKKDW
jgi:hypothetical protein